MATEKRLIDANELTNFFGFMRKMWSGSEIMNVIDEAETVDAVEAVHAHWEDTGYFNVQCSNCGFEWFSTCQECGVRPDNTYYCPNCGAKMDGDGDG